MLQKPELLRVNGFINNVWTPAKSGETFAVKDPMTSQNVTHVASMGADDTELAIEVASEAFKAWRKTTPAHRSALLLKWYQLIQENAQDLAKIMSAENGKPFSEAFGEVKFGSDFLSFYAHIVRTNDGVTHASNAPNQRLMSIKEPVGPVAMITPWNFPHAMVTRKAGPALAAGCTVVLKPSEETPLSALALAFLAEEAGIPAGVLNIVPGGRNRAAEIGQTLTSSNDIRKLSFTGSTAVGKVLYRNSGSNIKKLSLELGGNAPFVVFDDAPDMDYVVSHSFGLKFRNCGQVCVSANRFYVHEKVHDAYVSKLKARVESDLSFGHWSSEKTTIGPLINQAGLEKVQRLVNDAVIKGATVVTGGAQFHPDEKMQGAFFQPTILTDVTTDMDISREEIFGPVVAIQKFGGDAKHDVENEIIELSNDTPAGLASYFFSKDNNRIWRVAQSLEYGMVGVNTTALSASNTPFGGVKQSGLGTEGSEKGLEEFQNVKLISIGGLQL